MMDFSALLMSFVSLTLSVGYEGLLCVIACYLIYSEMNGNTEVTDKESAQVPVETSTDKIADEKIIVWFEGNKYDLTRFAKRHPGGRDALLQYNGKDVAEILEETGHSHNAYKILEKCKCKD